MVLAHHRGATTTADARGERSAAPSTGPVTYLMCGSKTDYTRADIYALAGDRLQRLTRNGQPSDLTAANGIAVSTSMASFTSNQFTQWERQPDGRYLRTTLP